MIIKFDTSGTFNSFQSLLTEMDKDNTIQSIFILAGSENEYPPGQTGSFLKKIHKTIFGGVFTAVVHNNSILKKGVIIIGLREKITVKVISGLSDVKTSFDQLLEKYEGEIDEIKTMFVFVDGYSSQIGPFINSLYNIFGLSNNFIGGGAGVVNEKAIEMKSAPCLFTNQGVLEDSALLALSTFKSGIGVNHGWHKINGPYKVTETDGNAIKTLDWKPALQVYKDVVEKHSGKVITKGNFFDIAKSYPFGMSRIDSEIIVRDPFTYKGSEIILATPVLQESFVDILNGDINSLVSAAASASKESIKTLGNNKQDFTFLVDCVSRFMYYGDNFNKEIDAIKTKDVPLIGVLSMGEIANSGNEYMEFYNKTCVVCSISTQ